MRRQATESVDQYRARLDSTNTNEPTFCSICGDCIIFVHEAHDTYWQDRTGDSLSYVPTLHDHKP